jgi:hypothetical protein
MAVEIREGTALARPFPRQRRGLEMALAARRRGSCRHPSWLARIIAAIIPRCRKPRCSRSDRRSSAGPENLPPDAAIRTSGRRSRPLCAAAATVGENGRIPVTE